MSTQQVQAFHVIGISIRTTNEHGQSAKDIPALWTKFTTEGTLNKIPGRVNDTIYSIYTDYEKDHTKPYTTIIGCKVESLGNVPDGMVGKTIEAGMYETFLATGNIMQGIVIAEWIKIWAAQIPRAFTADFEVYDERASDPTNATVEIFIAVK